MIATVGYTRTTIDYQYNGFSDGSQKTDNLIANTSLGSYTFSLGLRYIIGGK